MEDIEIGFEEVRILGEGRFELIGKIAQGGNATVWKAEELSDANRKVAVKVIEATPEQIEVGSPSLIERFRDEVKTWNEFASSRNVVALHYTFRQRTKPPCEAYFLGFVMELSEMGDLSKYIQRQHEFVRRRKDLYNFLRRIASAIKEGHDKDITHGDIKPHNVLLFQSDGIVVPKVMDFGLGISSSIDVAKYGGTSEYLAPERFGIGTDYRRPKEIDEAKRSDVYSLGVLFYEVVAQHRPYIIEERLNDQDRWVSYGKLHKKGEVSFDEIPGAGGEELAQLIQRMMSLDPERRPIMRDVVRTLDRMVEDSGTIVAREEDCPIAIREYRWNPVVHKLLGSRLYYYLIRGRSPDGDPVWFKNQLEERSVRSYSFYRILGGYDYVLRVWSNANYSEVIDEVVESFKLLYRTDYQKFSVAELDPCYGTKPLEFSDENAVLERIEQISRKGAETTHFAELKKAGLVMGRLGDSPRNSIRFFVAVSVSGSVNDAMLRLYSSEIGRAFRSGKGVSELSLFRGTGSGPIQILCKFRLKKFQDYRKIYDRFLQVCEYVRIGDSQIGAQTYVELDEMAVVESDDGPIVGELIRRLDD